MATVTLTKVFINLLSTGEAVSAMSQRDRTVTYGKRGDVRVYAGGRLRAVTLEGAPNTFSFVLQDVVRADIDKLRAWAGLPVQVRDNRGRVWTGVYFDVPENERFNEPTLYTVPIVLNGVTEVEEI